MGSITPTPTVDKWAAFTLAVVSKGVSNSSKTGSITLTPKVETRVAFTLAIV